MKARQRKERGHYVLICRVRRDRHLVVGALGTIRFQQGYYGYVGSALGGIEGRLRVHLRTPAARRRWHLDYLLGHAEPLEAIWAQAETGRECALAAFMSGRFPGVRGFGCSDCRCPSHLFWCGNLAELKAGAMQAFRHLGRHPRRWCAMEARGPLKP